MLTRISGNIAIILCGANKEKEELYFIYQYGLELIFSTLFSIFTVFIISVLIGKPEWGLTFLLFLIPIRLFAGGYHAPSYGRCWLLCNSLAVFTCTLTAVIPSEQKTMIALCLMIPSTLIIFFLSPVIPKNHTLSAKKKLHNGRIAKVIIILECILVIVGSIFGQAEIFLCGALTTAIVAGLIITDMIERRDRYVRNGSKAS